MKTQYQIGQKVSFKTTIFGEKKIKTNTIKFIEEINNENIYFIGGVSQSLGIQLDGKEDCYTVTENNIINK
tara:strand:+ start:574 stop:786 length:213 start_codon:yes stop_codon:yes gene_type:complete